MHPNPESAVTGGVFGRSFRVGIAAYVCFELISLIGHLIPSVSTAAFLALVAVTAIAAWRDMRFGLLLLLAELFIGSQGGYMVAFSAGGTFVSLRIGLFLAVFGVWFAKSIVGWFRGRLTHPDLAWFAVLHDSRLLWPYAALLAALAYGGLRGLALNDPAEVFFDANGYAYFALLPAVAAAFAMGRRPTASVTGEDEPTLRTRILALAGAAVTVAAVKALVVLFLFSHRQFGVAWQLYVWVRDTRVGEITIMTADFYRIFFQSQIWSLSALFMAALAAAYGPARGPARTAAWTVLVAAMVAMVLSLSRSFWFGGAVAAFAAGALLAATRADWQVWRRLLIAGTGSLLAAVIVIMAVYASPWPAKTGDLSLAMLLGSRATSLGDAAASSRWALLPALVSAGREHPVLGSGLGRQVTYRTSDPRLLADNPTGEYTTSAFEWGYHDLWVKFGLPGLAAYAWLLWRVARRMWTRLWEVRSGLRSPTAGGGTMALPIAAFRLGLIVTLVALLATNVFSPYLNHPLGIGLIMLLAVL